MPIKFVCPQCGRSGKVPDGFQGARIKCPACNVISPFQPGAVDDSTIPLVELPPEEPKPVRAETPKPAMKRKKEEKKPALPMAMVVGVGAAATVLLLGLVAVFLFKSGGDAQPQATSREEQAKKAVAPSAVPATSPPTVAIAPVFAANRANPGTKAGMPGAKAPSVRQPGPSSPPTLPAATQPGSPPGTVSSASEPIPAPDSAKRAIEPVAQTKDDTVKMIQDATVFIMVRARNLRGSGSGFVIQSDGDTLLIATNHHVVNPEMDGAPESDNPQRPGSRSAVTVVLRSGGGPGIEQSLQAEVIADDGEGSHDLAILQVRKVKNPPEAISLSTAPEPTITMPLLIYGFPFGNLDQQLDPTLRRNPSITVNRGSVSSLKKDQFNQLARIQIDGSINPGNSGGPVVDEKGRLVGVAVAKINNTNIGFAIPGAELTRMLEGRLGPTRLGMKGESGGQANLQVQVSLIDPLKRIESVDFLFAPAGKGSQSAGPDADGSWPPLEHAETVNLTINGPSASGDFKARIKSPADRRLVVQTAYHLASGKTVYTNPTPYQVPTRPMALARTGAAERPKDRGPVATFSVLGPLIDPLKNAVKDSKIERDPTSMTIEVPPGLRLLSLKLDQKSAPMTLAEVDGDFIAEVKVTGSMNPGMEPTRYKGKDVLPGTFQGAGLVLLQDSKNYVRLERTVKTDRGKPLISNEALLEVVQNGKMVLFSYPKVPDQPLFLRIQRVSGALDFMFSTDGRRWASHKKLAVIFPSKVQVGLLACNMSKQPLTAHFEQFVLITKKKEQDEKADE